jgi:hypothetical protein
MISIVLLYYHHIGGFKNTRPRPLHCGHVSRSRKKWTRPRPLHLGQRLPPIRGSPGPRTKGLFVVGPMFINGIVPGGSGTMLGLGLCCCPLGILANLSIS